MSSYFPNPFFFFFFNFLARHTPKKKDSDWIYSEAKRMEGSEKRPVRAFPCIHLTLAGWGGGVCSAHLDARDTFTCMGQEYYTPAFS